MNKKEVLKTISDVLNKKISGESLQQNEEHFDSLKHIQIIMELEEKFAIEIPIEKVPELTSVNVLLEYLKIESDD